MCARSEIVTFGLSCRNSPFFIYALRYVLKASNTPENNEPMETAATPSDTAALASQPPPPAVNTMHSDLPDEPSPGPVPTENPSPPSQIPEAAAQTCQTLPVQQEQAEPPRDQHQVVRPKSSQAAIQMPQEASSVPQVDEEQAGPSHRHHSHSTTPSNFVPFSGGGQRLGGSGNDEPRECPLLASPLSSGPPKAKKAKPSHDLQVRGRVGESTNPFISALGVWGLFVEQDITVFSIHREPTIQSYKRGCKKSTHQKRLKTERL